MRDERGVSLSVWTAVAMPAFIVAVGLGVDFSGHAAAEQEARAIAGQAARAATHEVVLTEAGVSLDPATRQVMRDGQPVLLSAREYAVLELLMQRPGAVLSRAQIEDRLYGWGEEIESNAVSVYIHQLRKKLGADFIRNVRGVGYFIDATAPGSDR